MKITIEMKNNRWAVLCYDMNIIVYCDSIKEAAEFAVQLAEQINNR